MKKHRLVTQAEFARMENVNRSTVARWIKSGRIQATQDGLIDPVAASGMREVTESPLPQHQARKDQIDEQKRQSKTGPAKEKPENHHQPHQKAADKPQVIRPADELLRHKTELLKLEIEQKTKTLIERKQAESVLADFALAVRSSLEGMPDRVAHAIAAHRGDVGGVQKELEGAVNDILIQVSDLMGRKAQELSL
jgi:hypothetical protein